MTTSKYRVLPDPDSVARAFCEELINLFRKAGGIRMPVGIMVPGGRTPKAAYQLVAQSGVKIPRNISIIISDERHVPPGDADSNFTMMKPFLEAIGCGPDRRIFVNTLLGRREAAIDFGRQLGRFTQAGGSIEACFLGLGADGHTASLFNDSQLKAAVNYNAIDVDRPDGKAGISAAPMVIRGARRIVFVVTGADKADMVKSLVENPGTITAGKVVFGHPFVELLLDQAAAAKLTTPA